MGVIWLVMSLVRTMSAIVTVMGTFRTENCLSTSDKEKTFGASDLGRRPLWGELGAT